MNTFKGIVSTAVTFLVAGAALMIGYNAGETIWENGLDDKVAEKARKVFSKKEEN